MLYTIGHSDHDLEAFIGLLRQHRIEAVGDVRSAPFSRRHPQFNKPSLERALPDAGIAYVFLGRELGARIERSEYHSGGRVDFGKVATADFFRAGLERVREGMRRFRLALMCAERDPLTCHRTALVTRNLRDEDMAIRHILADGSIETNEELEARMLEAARLPAATLFEDRTDLIERAYERLNERVGYRPQA